MKQMGTAKELTVEATVDNLNKVTSFVEEALEETGCPMKAQMQINIAIDEKKLKITNSKCTGYDNKVPISNATHL